MSQGRIVPVHHEKIPQPTSLCTPRERLVSLLPLLCYVFHHTMARVYTQGRVVTFLSFFIFAFILHRWGQLLFLYFLYLSLTTSFYFTYPHIFLNEISIHFFGLPTLLPISLFLYSLYLLAYIVTVDFSQHDQTISVYSLFFTLLFSLLLNSSLCINSRLNST